MMDPRVLTIMAALALGMISAPLDAFAEGGATTRAIEQASETPVMGTTSVVFDRAVHFLAPGGGDQSTNPGTYRVEAAEGNLQFIPAQGKEGILVAANKGSHDVKI